MFQPWTGRGTRTRGSPAPTRVLESVVMPVRTLAILVGTVTTILVGWVFHVAAGILQPLVIAAFLCSMLQPVVRWLAKRYVPPPVTVIVIVTLLFLVIARVGAWAQGEVRRFVGAPPSPTSTASHESRPTPTAVAVESEVGEPSLAGSEGQPDEGTATAEPGDSAEPQDPRIEPGTDDGDPGFDGHEEPATEDDGEAENGDSDEDETQADDEGEGEDETKQLGWKGIIGNLAVRLRDSNLPEPLTTFLISSMEQIDATAFTAGIVGNTLGFFTGLLLVVIYMLFIFAEQAIFRRKILSVAGDRSKDAADALETISRGVQRYLSVKTVISLATGILCYSVLEGLKVPYAHFFGFMTFLLNYIPTFGSLAAGGLATITTFASKGSWESALIVAVTYLGVNLTLGSYIEPRILGRELNLSPLVIVISVVVWAGLWGIAGTFLAVPLMATIQIILANNETTRPIAILLSSGPPREERRVAAKKKARPQASYPGS